MPYITVEGCMWMADVYTFSNEMYDKLPLTTMVCKTYEEAIEKGITNVVFDRGGFIYQGKVQALADAAREAGLEF